MTVSRTPVDITRNGLWSNTEDRWRQVCCDNRKRVRVKIVKTLIGLSVMQKGRLVLILLRDDKEHGSTYFGKWEAHKQE